MLTIYEANVPEPMEGRTTDAHGVYTTLEGAIAAAAPYRDMGGRPNGYVVSVRVFDSPEERRGYLESSPHRETEIAWPEEKRKLWAY